MVVGLILVVSCKAVPAPAPVLRNGDGYPNLCYADLVVIARVEYQQSYAVEGRWGQDVRTLHSLVVERVLRGVMAEGMSVTLDLKGGVWEEEESHVAGNPDFDVYERYLLFLMDRSGWPHRVLADWHLLPDDRDLPPEQPLRQVFQEICLDHPEGIYLYEAPIARLIKLANSKVDP